MAAGAARAAAEAAGSGDPPVDAGGQSFAETRRLMEWLTAEQQQQQQQQLAGLPPGAAVHVQGSGGLSAGASYALSCPHCGTPAAPAEDAGAWIFALSCL